MQNQHLSQIALSTSNLVSRQNEGDTRHSDILQGPQISQTRPPISSPQVDNEERPLPVSDSGNNLNPPLTEMDRLVFDVFGNQQYLADRVPVIQTPKPKRGKLRLCKVKHTCQECPICLLSIRKNSLVPDMKCKHIFHQKCLKPWAYANGSCPICRGQI